MRRNKLRELLNADQPSLGTHITARGHRYLKWWDIRDSLTTSNTYRNTPLMIYTPWDNIGRAIDLFDDMSAMIKVEEDPRGHIANRAIGAGIQNVLFADVRTVEDVAACVAAVRPDTPEDGGHHGVNMRRYVRFGVDTGGAEFIQSCRDSLIAIMIEKKEAVENLEALLSVPGLDMIQFGPGIIL